VTLHAVVPEAARRFGDAPAFVSAAGWPLSYADLDRLSDELAAALAADHGVRPGDLVALALPSTVEYVVAYAAVAKLGAITAGVNPRSTPVERDAVLDRAQPALVLATVDLSSWPTVVVELADHADAVLADVRRGHAGDVAPALDDPDDADRLVAVVFTSGTTGTPKGAMFGNRELAAITRGDLGEGAERWGGGGPMLASTQFSHIGFMTKLPWYLRLGTTTYLLDRWRAADVLRIVHDTHMTSVGGVAPQVALMLDDPTFDELDFSHVQTLVIGGALSPPDLVRRARERFGAAYSIRYSSTESGGVGTATAFDADDDEALHTVGRPRGDVELEIRLDDGEVAPTGAIGEICLRSSCMMRGYWRDDEATRAALPDGWLHSGDLGWLDDDGRLHLAGRSKEMFVRGGYNVYPLEVEAVLASHPAVGQIAVVPRPDRVMGEIGVAVVVPVADRPPPTLDELRSFGAEALSSYKLPERLRLVDQLPLTPMQKVDRRALAAVEAARQEATADGE
jgi:acyl-CoA synthetase (AMP-forming)/AMP-acid ligase II